MAEGGGVGADNGDGADAGLRGGRALASFFNSTMDSFAAWRPFDARASDPGEGTLAYRSFAA